MRPNLFAPNENHAYIMPHVITHAVMSCMHHTAHTCRQAAHPYVNVACQKLLMDMLFAPVKRYLSKLIASHFSTLNMKIANQNVLKRILIAMHNKNKAECNVQDMCRGSCRTSVQAVVINRPVGMEIFQLQV